MKIRKWRAAIREAVQNGWVYEKYPVVLGIETPGNYGFGFAEHGRTLVLFMNLPPGSNFLSGASRETRVRRFKKSFYLRVMEEELRHHPALKPHDDPDYIFWLLSR